MARIDADDSGACGHRRIRRRRWNARPRTHAPRPQGRAVRGRPAPVGGKLLAESRRSLPTADLARAALAERHLGSGADFADDAGLALPHGRRHHGALDGGHSTPAELRDPCAHDLRGYPRYFPGRLAHRLRRNSNAGMWPPKSAWASRAAMAIPGCRLRTISRSCMPVHASSATSACTPTIWRSTRECATAAACAYSRVSAHRAARLTPSGARSSPRSRAPRRPGGSTCAPSAW